jgi:predicted membrane protein
MYTDNSLISPALTDFLNKNEKIELIRKVDKRATLRSVRMYLLIALAIIVILDGYLWTSGMLTRDTFSTTILVILFWNIPTLLVLGAAYRTHKRMDKAFYALTNMRIIYATLSQSKKIDSVYFKDVHEVVPHKNMLKIDLNDMGENGKRFRHVQGVNDPEDFCAKINQRLESFRLGPQ